MKFKNIYGFFSTLVSGLILLFFGIYTAYNCELLFPWPYSGFLVYWFLIVTAFYLSYSFFVFIKKKSIKNNKITTSSPNTLMNREVNVSTIENPLKKEYYRKAFHLIGLLLIFGIYIALPVNDAILKYINGTGASSYKAIWGDQLLYPYSSGDPKAISGIIFFALFGAFFLIATPDYIRVLIGDKYSILEKVTKKTLRKKEIMSIGPQVFLLVGSMVSMLFVQLEILPLNISITAILVSCLSDAISAIIGRRFGKHKVKLIGDNIKSYEGFLAGFISAFFISLIFLSPAMALLNAFIFLLLDIITIPVADNILNPIFLTIVHL
ncbi:MAG: hypothetical protein ACTSRZ_07535 [Promethearchaeota archaeon]